MTDKAFHLIIFFAILLLLAISAGCQGLKGSRPLMAQKEYEKMIVGNLYADYVGTQNCLAACHEHDRLKEFFDASTMGAQLRKESGLPLVDCESCHGPASAYIADDVMGNKNKEHSFEEVIAKGVVFPVPEDTCRQCHNDRSPFNAALDPKYELVYSKESLDEQTHRHVKMKFDHGPLPAGTLFQESQ